MIEVEIKVQVTKEQKQNLLQGATFVSKKDFNDIYYDTTDYHLTINGYWLRKRGNIFELKYPADPSGNFNIHKNIAMCEITDESKIIQILKLDEQKSLVHNLTNSPYKPLYTLYTIREKYHKDGFIIDFDHATFEDLTYEICEIETIVNTQEQSAEALDKLYTFIKPYNISSHRAEGKFGFFIKRKYPAHYEAVLNSKKNV